MRCSIMLEGNGLCPQELEGHPPTPAATKFNATTPAPTPAATKSKPNANSPPTTSVTQSNKTETLNSTQTSASNESSTYTGKDDIVFTVTPAPINVGDNESSNGTADVQVLGPRLSNTADGDEDQTTSGKPATVSFAATASDIGGLSNELMGLLAAVVAFVAVVVAAAALVYIRSRLVREDVKEGEEEDLVVDESAEKDEELDENANSNAEPPTPVIVPSTPAAVTGQIAVTPIAASTSTKLTTPVPKVAPVSVAMASVEVTSNADSSEIEGHDHQGADNDSQ
ncbi:uncharacterized protein PHALS_07785 [Plasmopara halstedii]|uniref:Uncharacterized protein n=1 Tax=Plasmopara halstedii TaxID=4781 RepID=A0A0P1B5F6_PLAHL|nr:uncharacterized protein PHALS_07785 [Plasmopara halstedii]CEG50056.1 hypothetical protein PHALS_07785 [Plasmopara halstedii]|eukprot:XP_024586425.1 hypothetical protein PHALS_07785 [Plasmopara halstedii]